MTKETRVILINELRDQLAQQANYFKHNLNYTFGDYEANVDYSVEGFIALCEEMGHPVDEEIGIPLQLAQPLADWLKEIWEQA